MSVENLPPAETSQLAAIRARQFAPEPLRSRLPAWRLKKVQAFVEANISDSLRLGDLAAATGLSRMHFAAQFRAATGVRPHDYILIRRIEHTMRLIATHDPILVQVALDCGFQSQAHFCTIFKRLTGLTPTAWRRLLSDARDASPGEPVLVRRSTQAPADTLLVRRAARAPAGLPNSALSA